MLKYMGLVLKASCLLVSISVSASCLLISISVSASLGRIANYFDPKKEEDAIASPDDIYEDSDADIVVIEAGGKEIILSIRAEKRLLKILNEREKSSSLYI